MKTFRTALLAAAIGAGLPALLHAQDAPQDRRERFREQGEMRGPRPDGETRFERGTPPQPTPQASTPAQPQSQPQPQSTFRNQDLQRRAAPDRGDGPDRFDRRSSGGRSDGDRGDRRFGDRNAPQSVPGRFDRPNGFAAGRPGFDRGNGDWQRPSGFGRPGGDWRGRDWRQDRRYDWQGYRDRNRSLFRAPRYYAPRGWAYGYRRFDIGFRLPPFLFGSQYWIADPWSYRLPPVDGPYRWVRYYNDVLLIDLRSGAVVDEIPDFFW